MTRAEELETIAKTVDEAGLGSFEVIPPQPGGADRWDVRFVMAPGIAFSQATGIAFDGRSSFENLLRAIKRVGIARKAVNVDLPRMQARFEQWRADRR